MKTHRVYAGKRKKETLEGLRERGRTNKQRYLNNSKMN